MITSFLVRFFTTTEINGFKVYMNISVEWVEIFANEIIRVYPIYYIINEKIVFTATG